MTTTNVKSEMLRDVQQFILDTIDVSGSQNEAAHKLGISAAHIINLREGAWEKVSRRLFNRMMAQAGLSVWQDYETENLVLATSLCASAQADSRMLALIGYTGSGKTHSLRLYARKTKRAYYVMADSEMNKKRFLNAILRAIGVRSDDTGNNVGEMIDVIIRKLTGESCALLIIDDAGKLTDSLLRIIQIIYDRTEGITGIVLAGTEYLEESVGIKARRNKMGFRELKRRIAYWENMEDINQKDVANICISNGIKDESAMAYLYNNCGDFGTLRNMILNALTVSDNGMVTRELLAQINESKRWHTGNW